MISAVPDQADSLSRMLVLMRGPDGWYWAVTAVGSGVVERGALVTARDAEFDDAAREFAQLVIERWGAAIFPDW
jgi:hypothetical protein